MLQPKPGEVAFSCLQLLFFGTYQGSERFHAANLRLDNNNMRVEPGSGRRAFFGLVLFNILGQLIPFIDGARFGMKQAGGAASTTSQITLK